MTTGWISVERYKIMNGLVEIINCECGTEAREYVEFLDRCLCRDCLACLEWDQELERKYKIPGTVARRWGVGTKSI